MTRERRDVVAAIFNGMTDDYDEMHDLWYSWLFSRLHYLIALHVLPKLPSGDAPRVLDVGCGTGLQTFLYAAAGATAVGLDVAPGLLDVAHQKRAVFLNARFGPLFPSYFAFVDRYHHEIAKILHQLSRREYRSPDFIVADAGNIPVRDQSQDHVNCCGSVLSFADDHRTTLGEISRVLKPGGSFVIEAEGRFNFDTIWTLLGAITSGTVGIPATLADAVELTTSTLRQPVTVQYPFGDEKNPVLMNIKLFTKRGLAADIEQVGMRVETSRSIHSLTNLMPSTILDGPSPGPLLRGLFFALASAEERTPIYLPGCSIVLFGTKL